MKQILRAALVSSLFASSLALAQDVEMNMNIQVDEDGEAQGVKMRVRGGTTSSTHIEVRGEERTEGHDRDHGRRDRDRDRDRGPRRRPSPPPAEPVFRDCGTGRDPGCTMTRDGQYAMDAETWNGFYQSLKSQPNEITREEMAEKMLKRNYLTAVQLGLLLDLYANEITRLDVAKTAAPHVVNPQHALGFSSKWANSISAGEYTELISEQ